jgi:hypothetical protein
LILTFQALLSRRCLRQVTGKQLENAKLSLSKLSLPDFEARRAQEAFDAGDGKRFGDAGYSCGQQLDLVFRNFGPLWRAGIYETALVEAYTQCKLNNLRWDIDTIEFYFGLANRKRLRAAGQPLPSAGPFTIYRGISGIGKKRRPRGMSWTDDIDIACWFATRFLLANPAIRVAKVDAGMVYLFTCVHDEREFIVRPARTKIHRMDMAEIDAGAARIDERRKNVQRAPRWPNRR